MDLPQLNYSPVEGHLDCFHLGANKAPNVNKAAMYIHYRFLCGHNFHFFGVNEIPSAVLDHTVLACLIFKETTKLF